MDSSHILAMPLLCFEVIEKDMSLRFWDRDKVKNEPVKRWSFKKTFIWEWDEWLLKIWNKIRRKR